MFSKAGSFIAFERGNPLCAENVSLASSASFFGSISSNDDFVEGRTSVDLLELSIAMKAKRQSRMKNISDRSLSLSVSIPEQSPLQYSKRPNRNKSPFGVGSRNKGWHVPIAEVFEDDMSIEPSLSSFSENVLSMQVSSGKDMMNKSSNSLLGISGRVKHLIMRKNKPFLVLTDEKGLLMSIDDDPSDHPPLRFGVESRTAGYSFGSNQS